MNADTILTARFIGDTFAEALRRYGRDIETTWRETPAEFARERYVKSLRTERDRAAKLLADGVTFAELRKECVAHAYLLLLVEHKAFNTYAKPRPVVTQTM